MSLFRAYRSDQLSPLGQTSNLIVKVPGTALGVTSNMPIASDRLAAMCTLITLQRSFTEVTRDVRTILERYDKDRDVSGAPD